VGVFFVSSILSVSAVRRGSMVNLCCFSSDGTSSSVSGGVISVSSLPLLLYIEFVIYNTSGVFNT
jgi:hypothetical protein